MKTAAAALILLSVSIIACSSDHVKLGNAGYIRPYAQIVVLNGGQEGVPLGTLYSGEYFLDLHAS
jgi:hypothetical protein